MGTTGAMKRVRSQGLFMYKVGFDHAVCIHYTLHELMLLVFNRAREGPKRLRLFLMDLEDGPYRLGRALCMRITCCYYVMCQQI